MNTSCTAVQAANAGGICKVVSFLTLITNMSSPPEMRCVTYDTSGTLSIATVPQPALKDGDIMIEVKLQQQ